MSNLKGKTSGLSRTVVKVTGVVQGVGFRPFIYQLATARGLSGHVINTPSGVEIDVEGSAADIASLIEEMRMAPPPLSVITGIEIESRDPAGWLDFKIGETSLGRRGRQLVSPDTCTCDDCVSELFDPADKRYRYPFINCTNCGPRFTIIEELPYDRGSTTMNRFTMCPACQAEYDDPTNRRFHAEPNACHDCGPQLWLTDQGGSALPVADTIISAATALSEGKILALKGLGGFQLACLATSEDAVQRLRDRKLRPQKPFAVMIGSADEAAMHCQVSSEEREVLESVQRPIVLLRKHHDCGVSQSVAPRLEHLGVMLPYSPIHFLLMDEIKTPLVMTSGNLSEEPICRTNYEALTNLANIADLFMLHDRRIRSTYDDSVVMVEDGRPVLLRRARGYAPMPVKLPVDDPGQAPNGLKSPGARERIVFAAGPELKNTFCLARGDEAFLSQHMGDLENVDTLLHYERTEALFERLFDSEPDTYVCDSHPDYLSTAYCLERHPVPFRVQHHQAHIAACLADNGHTSDVIGIALDGTGFGADGAIWGGEFFSGGLRTGFSRVAHLEQIPLLGGEAAIREPWRTALAAVWKFAPDKLDLAADILEIPAQKRGLLLRQLTSGLNCPMTSSCGRLFDAVAALATGRVRVSYEAQAAIELEALCWGSGEDLSWSVSGGSRSSGVGSGVRQPYRFELLQQKEPWRLSPAAMIDEVISDLESGTSPREIALRFHLGLAEAIVETGLALTERFSRDTIALSGGVFQNRVLLGFVSEGLAANGIKVLSHGQVPPNDGGVALGQAALTIFKIRE